MDSHQTPEELPAQGEPRSETESLQREIARLRALVSRDLGILERERIFSDRLARLHAFTASVADAVTVDEVCRATVEHGRAALDAQTAAIWLAAPDGSARLAHHAGYPDDVVRRCEVIPAGSPTPIGEAIADGASAWVPSRADLVARWPDAIFEGWYEADFAVATLPLETRGGRLGAIAITFARPRSFSTEDRAMLIAMARQATQAMERAHLLDAERRARADAEAEHHRMAFLFEASALLGSSLEWEQTLGSVARLAVPRFADWCTVDFAEDVQQRRPSAVIAHADPAKVEMARELGRRYPPDPDAPHGVANVLRTGEPELIEEVTDDLLAAAAVDDEHLRIARELGLRSAMVVPMPSRGRILGAITFVSAESGRRYGAADLTMAGSLARRCALAIENARLYSEAQRAIRARDDVLAIVSHDLRNPLHAIVMASNLLQRATSLDRTRYHAAAIERSARRAGRLIRDLLDLSTLEAGRVTLDRAPADVAALLSDAAALIQPLASDRSIQVVVVPPLPGEQLEVLCDRERILQVFSNLLGNALNFTPVGGRVTLEAVRAGDEVRFSVRDTGPGVPPENRTHIFDRYWKTRDSRQGAGLGLSIARNLVDAHGGRIWVDSTPGVGATFSFTVPLVERPAVAAGATA